MNAPLRLKELLPRTRLFALRTDRLLRRLDRLADRADRTERKIAAINRELVRRGFKFEEES